VRTPKGEGPSAGHGRQHEFVVTVRDREHPITRGCRPPGSTAPTSCITGSAAPRGA
jgi:hypothetical protein